jgi:hypothetical protein
MSLQHELDFAGKNEMFPFPLVLFYNKNEELFKVLRLFLEFYKYVYIILFHLLALKASSF